MLNRIPVVGGLAFIERVRELPSTFEAVLKPAPGHVYFRHAIEVQVASVTVGYVAPEAARRYFEPLAAWQGEAVRCPGRRAGPSDRATSGVELLLDFSALPVQPVE
jgi:hypothetical protein